MNNIISSQYKNNMFLLPIKNLKAFLFLLLLYKEITDQGILFPACWQHGIDTDQYVDATTRLLNNVNRVHQTNLNVYLRQLYALET